LRNKLNDETGFHACLSSKSLQNACVNYRAANADRDDKQLPALLVLSRHDRKLQLLLVGTIPARPQ
jgi:hypothetical protein